MDRSRHSMLKENEIPKDPSPKDSDSEKVDINLKFFNRKVFSSIGWKSDLNNHHHKINSDQVFFVPIF